MRPWSNLLLRSWALALLLPAGCVSLVGSQTEAEADQAFQMGHYARAHETYRTLLESRPGDQDLARKERIARLSAWLAAGKEAVFLDDLPRAELFFRKILAEVPDHRAGQAWLAKVHTKQADLLVLEAQGQISRQEFRKARRLAGQALALWPGHERAVQLMAELDERMGREQALGRLLLAEGLRVLQESVEDTHLVVTRHYLHGARALMGEEFVHDWVLEEVERRMRQQAREQVQQALARDEHASALVEASQAVSLLTDFPALQELRELAQRELEADALAEEARQLILRKNPDAGREKMALAARTSPRRRGLFKAAQVEVEEARLALDYQEALDLEAKGRHAQALERFQAIAKQDPHFRDAEARAHDLESSLAEADRILGEVRVLAAQGAAPEAVRRLKDLFVLFPWHQEGLQLLRSLEEPGGKAP